MSNDLVRYGQRALVKSDDSMGKTISGGLVASGVGGLALCGVAALLPFVGVFGLSILMLVLGALAWVATK